MTKLTGGRLMAGLAEGGAPQVTVLLPVRNGAAHLGAAVASILAQTLEEFELLVVDDGSSDATEAILTRVRDPRLRLLRQPPLGLVPALNRGLQAARGALVARMDADDVAHPKRLARQVEAFAGRPELALVGTGWRVLTARGAPRVVLPPASDADIRTGMASANVLAHPTVMYRRTAVLGVGGYRPAFLLAEDYDLWLRLLGRHAAACVPEVLLDYREHAGQSAWRDLEQRILSEMGAQAAAACRAAGRDDQGDGTAPIDRGGLLRMGMSGQAIAAGIVARALGAAKAARAARQAAPLRAAVRLGLRQPGSRVRTRIHFVLLGATAAAWSRMADAAVAQSG